MTKKQEKRGRLSGKTKKKTYPILHHGKQKIRLFSPTVHRSFQSLIVSTLKTINEPPLAIGYLVLSVSSPAGTSVATAGLAILGITSGIHRILARSALALSDTILLAVLGLLSVQIMI